MSKKIIEKHIQYKDGSYDVEMVEVTNTKRLEEIKAHNKEVRKYIYETKKITSKYSIDQIEEMTGQEVMSDELDPLEKLIEAEEGNFYDDREAKFEDGLAILSEALDTLTPKQKHVFIAVVVEGKSRREIANELNVCNKTINECYDSALKKLRKFFLAHPEFVNYFPGLKK